MRRFRLSPLAVSFALAAWLAPRHATAQEERTPAPEDGRPGDRPFHLATFSEYARYAVKAGLKGEAGNVSVAAYGAAAGMQLPLGRRISLDLGFSASRIDYDFAAASAIRWEDVQEFGSTFKLDWRLDETVSFFAGGMVGSRRETDAGFGDSWTGGGMAGVTCRLHERFVLGAGFLMSSSLDDRAPISPVLMVDWEFADHWRFALGSRENGALSLTYGPSPEWDFSLRADGISRSFRLDDGGIGRDTRITVGLEAAWKPLPASRVSLFVGGDLWGRLNVIDGEGRTLNRVELEAAPAVGIGIGIAY